eukprot:50300_1
MLTPTSSKSNSVIYKQMLRKVHDIKHDVRNIKMRRLMQCLFLIFIVSILYLFHQHILPNPLLLLLSRNLQNTTNQSNISVNLTTTNNTDILSQNASLLTELGINPKNLSQLNIIQFIKNWGKSQPLLSDDTSSDKKDKSLHKNIWNKNISHRPPAKIPDSALDEIQIQNIVWDFGACGCTGWGIEIVNIIKPLSQRITDIKLITGHDCWCPGFTQTTIDLMNTLQSNEDYTNWDPIQIFVSHKPPSRYPQFPYHGLIDIDKRPQIVIGRSMTEVDYIIPEDLDRMKSNDWVDELWVPSRFVKIVYVRHGIHPNKIRVIGEPINIDIYNEKVKRYRTLPSKNRKKNLIKITKKTIRFLSVGKWEPRKGFDILLKAFLSEFKGTDDVQLYIQTYAYDQSETMSRDYSLLEGKLNATIEQIISEDDTLDEAYVMQHMYPKIEIMTKQRTMKQLASLYATVNCLVQPSHGEGFGLPVLEAMAVGTPVIVTKWSGLRDVVVSNAYGYLVEVEGREFARNTPGRSDFIEDKQKWAKINVTSLMSNMRNVYQFPKRAKQIGQRGQTYVMQHFHPDIIADKIEQRMKELLYLKQNNLIDTV